MILKTKSWHGSDNDKTDKHHKYTPDEALQAALEFNDDSHYLDFSNSRQTFLVFQGVFCITSFHLSIRLQDVITGCIPNTSSWRLCKTSSRCLPKHLQCVFKTSLKCVAKCLWHLEDVLKASWKTKYTTLKTSSRRLHYVFTKTNVFCVRAQSTLKYQSSNCNELQIVFCSWSLAIKAASWYMMWVKSDCYSGHLKHSCILYFCITSLLE